jgi:hypothetical protein
MAQFKVYSRVIVAALFVVSANAYAGLCDSWLEIPISQVASMAQEKGLTVVVSWGRRLSKKELDDLAELYGVPVRNFENHPKGEKPEKIPGVVVHLGPQKLKQAYVGDFNPSLGDPDVLGFVDAQKWHEYLFARAVDPNVIPTTENVMSLIINDATFGQKRQHVIKLIDEYGELRSRANQTRVVAATTDLLKDFFEIVKQRFPGGAVIKYVKEAATGDNGQVITTQSPVAILVETFMNDIHSAQRALPRKASHFDQKHFQEEIVTNDKSASLMVASLLLAPENIMVQQVVDFVKTRDGHPLEIRVDVLSGKTKNATLRRGLDYVPEAEKLATLYVSNFLARAPKSKWGRISGGFDVAFTIVDKNGKPDIELAILDFNFGSESGFMDASDMVIAGNKFISQILGQSTPLLQKLEQVFHDGLQAQKRFLSEQKVRIPDYSQSVRDLGLLEAALYFRNRHLDEWSRDKRSAPTVFAAIKDLLEPQRQRSPTEIQTMIDVARDVLGVSDLAQRHPVDNEFDP